MRRDRHDRRAGRGRSLFRLGMAVFMALSLVGEGLAASGCDDVKGTAIHPQVDWQADIKPILNTMFGGRCTGCHNGGLPPDMSDTGVDAIFKLVNFYVKPGRPLESRLFIKINCESPDGGGRMPLAGQVLTRLQQELIYDWISQGALGEAPAGSISRTFVFRDGVESLRD